VRPGIITITGLKLASVFPVLKGYYDDHPIGSIVVSNTGKETARNFSVSMIIRQYMDAPKECATIAELAPGESRELPVFALFNGSILDVTEMTKVSAEVRIDYSDSVAPLSQTKTATMVIYDRNALTWDNNEKAAAFVSGKDPWVLVLSNNVTSAVKDLCNAAINRNLQTAIAFHAALRQYGLSYVVNPKSPFAQAQANPEIVDFVKFPRQTLAFKAGDCSDLSVLYASFFESVGVETAFITVPGHIFMAINLDIDPRVMGSQFSATDDLIVRDGKVWLPIEVTLRGSSLADAWKHGAGEWRENLAVGTADFYPVHEAWKSFAPVGLPADGSSAENVPARPLTVMYSQEVGGFVDQELAVRLAALGGAGSGPQTPKLLNSRGVLKARYGRLAEAAEEFLAATKGKPFAPALVNLGNIAALRADNAAALSYYQQAVKLAPDSSALLVNLSRAQRALGHVQDADTAIARAAARPAAGRAQRTGGARGRRQHARGGGQRPRRSLDRAVGGTRHEAFDNHPPRPYPGDRRGPWRVRQPPADPRGEGAGSCRLAGDQRRPRRRHRAQRGRDL
jgi:tetratricopeptide (TPR) repeat protein